MKQACGLWAQAHMRNPSYKRVVTLIFSQKYHTHTHCSLYLSGEHLRRSRPEPRGYGGEFSRRFNGVPPTVNVPNLIPASVSLSKRRR
ncbi:hypothetical protein Hanom_Chr11g01023351 [Helianthus anomalus]